MTCSPIYAIVEKRVSVSRSKGSGYEKRSNDSTSTPIQNARLFSRRTESTEQALRKSGLQKTGLFPRALYVIGEVTHNGALEKVDQQSCYNFT